MRERRGDSRSRQTRAQTDRERRVRERQKDIFGLTQTHTDRERHRGKTERRGDSVILLQTRRRETGRGK